IARFPALRDRSVFVGNPDDVVPHGFGDGLPAIRDWVERNYRFSGYVSGFEPGAFADRDALRAELGYRPGEQVCVVTVGGSGVGTDLLRRAVAAYPAARALVPGLRMVVVTGPRIDPDSLTSLSAADGLEVRGYVPDLYRHLAACDLAVVQGGLTTTMELAASGRPFIYVPLRHHFEQNFHVRHRLDRYGAGRRPAVRTHLSSPKASRTSRSTCGSPCSAASRAARWSAVRACSRWPSRARARPSAANAAARAGIHGSRSATASNGASAARARSGSPCPSHASASDRYTS